MRLLELTKGKHAIIDEADYMKVGYIKWHLSSRGYACGWGRNGTKRAYLLLHRELMDCPSDKEIDHINGNKLDNRRQNLRVVTRAQNMMNRRKGVRKGSIFKGVTPKGNKWAAQIIKTIDSIKQRHWLGTFSTQEEAAQAYNEKAKELFKEYALLNIIN